VIGSAAGALYAGADQCLDTHPETKECCRQYLAVASELYKAIQQNYRAVWDQSREWAQATIDAILSLDLVQVRIRHSDGGVR
jgi:hypothetical protein